VTACVHDHARYGPARWGPDERIGAGNLLIAERRLAALSLVRTGELHDLGHVIENLRLDTLVAAGHTALCFVVLATKLKGATGCPVRPVAMV